MVCLSDRLNMTIAVDWDILPQYEILILEPIQWCNFIIDMDLL